MTVKNNQKTYFVKGMHCPSCELLIERELLRFKGVRSVAASASQGRVVVGFVGSNFQLKQVNQKLKKLGYRLSTNELGKDHGNSLFNFQNGQILVDREKAQQFVISLMVLLIFSLFFWGMTRMGIASKIIVSRNSSFLTFFFFGLMAGFSSCAALVGGLVLSMSRHWSQVAVQDKENRTLVPPYFLFNFSRLMAFLFFGGLLGLLGESLQLSLTITATMTVLVSVMMVLLGMQMLGFHSFNRFQFRVPKIITNQIARQSSNQKSLSSVGLGILTFFLPCGFTLTVQGLALASGDPIVGALILFFFALGTLPMLLLIGFTSHRFLLKPKTSRKFLKTAGLLVVFFGFYNFNSQLNVLGLPSINDLQFGSGQEVKTESLNSSGQQVIRMKAFSYAYEPNYFQIKAGIPVRWEISNQGVSGCTNAIIAKGLFEDEVKLDKELIVKEFTPEKPGRYKFSCWMGMVSGVIEVLGTDPQARPSVGKAIEIPSGVTGCGDGCTDGCTGGCGNSGCPYYQ